MSGGQSEQWHFYCDVYLRDSYRKMRSIDHKSNAAMVRVYHVCIVYYEPVLYKPSCQVFVVVLNLFNDQCCS